MADGMHRRAALKLMGAAAVGAGLSACAPRAARRPLFPARRFHPVRVSADRIIRTTVGLRPFRASGFVVRGEKLGEKTVIHNYGHGGGGITLSWGTSQLAAEEAQHTGERRAAVIGCGAVGLSAARLLQLRGWDVTIYAKDLPPHTTSNMAAGQWSPASVFDSRTPEFTGQFERALRFAYRYYQDLVGPHYGVRWIENYACQDREFGARIGTATNTQDLFPEAKDVPPGEHPFPRSHVRRFTTMFVEPGIYLPALLRDFQIAGGRVVPRDFVSRDALLALPERVLVNCSGLGAKALFGDTELTPIKGQLTVLLPQPDVDYITLADELYMMPRTDGILLGGTHERGEESLEPNAAARDRILAGHAAFFSGFRAHV